jgi:fatty acid desaturase
MSASNKLIAALCFVTSLLLFVGIYYFSYKSGCLFDGKSGYGDFDAAKPFNAAALASFLAAVAAFILSVYYWSRPKAQTLLQIFVIAVVLAIPIFVWCSFEGAVQGTQVCRPS